MLTAFPVGTRSDTNCDDPKIHYMIKWVVNGTDNWYLDRQQWIQIKIINFSTILHSLRKLYTNYQKNYYIVEAV